MDKISSTSTSSAQTGVSPAARRLIDCFEKDIVYDVHALRTNYRRSGWRRQIKSAGALVLGDLALHLGAIKDRQQFGGYESSGDMRQAWVWLLCDLAREHGMTPPEESSTLAQLSEWAMGNAPKRAA